MSAEVVVHESLDIIWTMDHGRLRAWQVRSSGTPVEVSTDQAFAYVTNGGLDAPTTLLPLSERVRREEGVKTLPHSRACGIISHPHGPMCAKDCPSCHPAPHDGDGPE